jgi:hypothetical protein
VIIDDARNTCHQIASSVSSNASMIKPGQDIRDEIIIPMWTCEWHCIGLLGQTARNGAMTCILHTPYSILYIPYVPKAISYLGGSATILIHTEYGVHMLGKCMLLVIFSVQLDAWCSRVPGRASMSSIIKINNSVRRACLPSPLIEYIPSQVGGCNVCLTWTIR